MSEYPEHDKLQAISDKSQTIGEFLDWVRFEKDFILADRSVEDDDMLWPASYNITELLAEFFDINLDKIEAEKRAMLDHIRSAQAQDYPFPHSRDKETLQHD